MNIFTLTMVPVNPPYDDAVKNLSINIARRVKGHKFFLISSAFGKTFDKKDNITFMRSVFQRRGRHSMSHFQKIFVFFLIMANMSRIDLFQFFITPQPYFSSVFRNMLKRRGKKSIQVVSSVYTLFDKNKDKTSIPGLFFGDRVVVYSDFAREKLEGMGIENVVRIYPGIDTERFSLAETESAQGRKFRVVYPGTYKVLKEAYSFDKFCSIAEKVIKDNDGNVEFIMACRIRSRKDRSLEKEFERTALRRGILDNITFLNTVEDMPSLFSGCDAGIMPAERSAPGVLEIPMVIPEIAATGKPVIYGNVPPFDELNNRGIGVMAEHPEPDAYASILTVLLKNASMAAQVGQRSRQGVMDNFDMEHMAGEYERLYNSLEGCRAN